MNAVRACHIFVVAAALGWPAFSFGEPPQHKNQAQASVQTGRPASLLIVRIDKCLLEPLRSQKVDHWGDVDQVVLGTRAVGKSHTTGTIDVANMVGRDDASFTVKFSGKTETKTVGYNGPALIYSRTHTDFVCTREVTFDPQKGFVASPGKERARTILYYDGFGSSRQGLGSRLVTRIAEERAIESYSAASQIAARDNREQISQTFDQRLNKQLAGINRELRMVRYANAMLNPDSQPRLAARSLKDCVLVGIARKGDSPRLVTLPPECKSAAPIEIWVHTSLLGDRATLMVGVFDRLESEVLPAASPFAVSQLQAPPAAEKWRAFDMKLHQGWIVVGLHKDAAPMVATSREKPAPRVVSTRSSAARR